LLVLKSVDDTIYSAGFRILYFYEYINLLTLRGWTAGFGLTGVKYLEELAVVFVFMYIFV